MCEEEKVHLSTFERLLPENRVRPTALLPIWDIAGFALGMCNCVLIKIQDSMQISDCRSVMFVC